MARKFTALTVELSSPLIRGSFWWSLPVSPRLLSHSPPAPTRGATAAPEATPPPHLDTHPPRTALPPCSGSAASPHPFIKPHPIHAVLMGAHQLLKEVMSLPTRHLILLILVGLDPIPILPDADVRNHKWAWHLFRTPRPLEDSCSWPLPQQPLSLRPQTPSIVRAPPRLPHPHSQATPTNWARMWAWQWAELDRHREEEG